MRKSHVTMITAMAIAAAACAAPDTGDIGPKQATGAAVGAIGGAVLGGLAGDAIGGGGKNAVAIGAGAALGGISGLLIGSSAGQGMDRVDRLYARRSWNEAMRAPIGEPVAWENAETGNSGQTVATRQGTLTSNSSNCREYTSKIKVGSKSETLVGTACRNSDGTWSERS